MVGKRKQETNSNDLHQSPPRIHLGIRQNKKTKLRVHQFTKLTNILGRRMIIL